jgi:hypothetical protein
MRNILYLLLINLTKQNITLLYSTDGIDGRPEITTESSEELVKNITINMEKQKLLYILEDNNISTNTKLMLVDNYFGSLNNIAYTVNNIFGGGLLKDSDF